MRICFLLILVASLLADIASGCKEKKAKKSCYDYATKKYDKTCKCKDVKYHINHPKYCGTYTTLGPYCQTTDGQR